MPKDKEKTEKAKDKPSKKTVAAVAPVAKGEGVVLPPVKARVVQPDRPKTTLVSVRLRTKPTFRAAAIGARELKHGAAFEAFCRTRGVSATEKRSLAEWADLLADFQDQPIHGYRRGAAGGSHRRGEA